MNDEVSEDGLEALIKAGMRPQSLKRPEGGWAEFSKTLRGRKVAGRRISKLS